MKTLKIRKAGDSDIPEIMSLFNAHTAPPKTASFFRWWNSTPSVTFCALDGERIVGLFVVLKRRLTNGITCGVLMGLIVDTPWRGSGLFGELGRQAMSECSDLDMFCCLTNGTGKRALEKSLAFRTIGTIETMTLANRPEAGFQASPLAPVTVETRFNHWDRGGKETLMFLADEAFRQWRFASHPRCVYRILRKASGEFVVINRYDDPVTHERYADIVDFEAESLQEDSLVQLLSDAYLNLAKDVDRVTLQAVPQSRLHGVVQKMGFTESRTRHYFCVNVKKPGHDDLYEASRWLIKWGDYLR
jgi:hypothetical protein